MSDEVRDAFEALSDRLVARASYLCSSGRPELVIIGKALLSVSAEIDDMFDDDLDGVECEGSA